MAINNPVFHHTDPIISLWTNSQESWIFKVVVNCDAITNRQHNCNMALCLREMAIGTKQRLTNCSRRTANARRIYFKVCSVFKVACLPIVACCQPLSRA
ncbi:hypothetical protein, partial [Vibrio tubiashii]